MPKVLNPAALATAHDAAKKKIDERDVPSVIIQSGQFLYRSINPESRFTPLPKPTGGLRHISKTKANALLTPPDNVHDLGNRFSGPSYNAHIPACGGLYCVQQQQALINESMHYSGKAGSWALGGRCILKIRVLGSILVGDLSPHNPRGERFLRELGKNVWDKMVDPKDCSTARGIGLAVANTGFLRGLSVETVRESERSEEERGDNLVLFGDGTKPIPGLTVDEAWYFSNKSSEPEIYEVAFP
jgi:hypothetical protein